MNLLPLLTLLVAAEPAPPPRPVESAVVESSLASAAGRVRQHAFDGDAETYFASAGNATKADHLTLTFDAPVALKSVAVVTGRPGGADALAAGVLEASADGSTFALLADFASGKAMADGRGRAVKALRVRPAADATHPLVVREFTVDSEPKVAAFRHPVEFTLDVSDAPDLKPWGDKAVRVCERQYPMICDLLASDGHRPPTQIRLTLREDYQGVAAAGGSRITGSAKYFRDHPDDLGAMVHETVHCVQGYRARGLPGWLVEGVADYVRFWKYEPGKAGRLNPDRAQYNASYRTTAAFLAYVTDQYDARAVPKLNSLLRSGKYDADAWKALTGKPVEELNQEWRRSLAK